MKRHFRSMCLLAATVLATPAAFSGSQIVKCIDDAGRVTLTDRPCEAGFTSVRVTGTPLEEGVTRVAPYPLVAERSVLPPPQISGRRHAPMQRVAAKPLENDVATLKAARAQFLLGDVGGRDAIAGLE